MDTWLSPDNAYLQRAVEQTIDEGYFSFSDVKHAVLAIKKACTEEAFRAWVSRSGMRDDKDARCQNVLCLHAGNLPLVGFQDALAVLLSGARYSGKISRKDPYLLPTFLNEVKKTKTWSGVDVQWTHRLDDFEDMPHDAMLFAGSEQSVPSVKSAIDRYNLAKDDARYLIRTAHFSLAYVDEQTPETMQALTEAILRYGGKGCRSVAVVVSPIPLKEVESDITRLANTFWEENPQHVTPKPKLKHRFAYNEAVGRRQIWLNDFLLQTDGLELDQDFICYWVQGDKKMTSLLADNFGARLQSIYVAKTETEIPADKTRMELLSNAQTPPIDWCPDGIDTLQWLCGDDHV